jgi:hypothetical protein
MTPAENNERIYPIRSSCDAVRLENILGVGFLNSVQAAEIVIICNKQSYSRKYKLHFILQLFFFSLPLSIKCESFTLGTN